VAIGVDLGAFGVLFCGCREFLVGVVPWFEGSMVWRFCLVQWEVQSRKYCLDPSLVRGAVFLFFFFFAVL